MFGVGRTLFGCEGILVKKSPSPPFPKGREKYMPMMDG